MKRRGTMNRNFSIRTLRLLAQLRDGEEINGGDIQSREMRGLMEFLLRQGAVSVIRQRSRLRYSAPNRDKFLMYLADYDHYLTNLDAAIRKAEGKTFSREDKTRLWGNSKEGGEEGSESGFSVISTMPVDVTNHGRTYRLTPDTALLVCDDGKELCLPEGWTVVVVENSRLFFRHDWLRNIGLDEKTSRKCFIIKRYPVTSEQMDFLKICPLPVLYFGDLDLGGIRIYESEYWRKVGNKIPFVVPPDAEERISGPRGNRQLYIDQMKGGLSNVESPSGRLSDLIRIIHKHQSCYEQEGYCYPPE